MKARIPVPKCYKKQIDDYCIERSDEFVKQKELDLVRRTMKFASIVLHEDFGFGKQRIEKLWRGISDLANQRQDDPVFWSHIDRELIKEIGLNVPRENYDELDM